ncbi:arsenate reductase [Litchfieldella xinjiangensis]|uniref:arsenate reductase n=1 Tax=Litchfieldella xinjiangensis TaxID=1166948 RepID=UPI0005BC01F4|nr:arsenate reductase [Halomonas xinjiangensis]
MITLYGIKACDTCRKARKALDAKGVDYRFHDLRDDGLDAERLGAWLARLPLGTLLNRRSTTWRQLDDAEKEDIDTARAHALMLAHPTLIKRPLLDTGNDLRVGYRNGDFDDLTP